MSKEIDPEVLADLQLRAQTERERKPKNADALYAYETPVFVGAWLCRACCSLVPITADAMEYAAVWNDELRRRGEAPMDANKIAICDSCRDKRRALIGDRKRAQVDAMAVEIRRLKEIDPEADRLKFREQVGKLRELGHPDVEGLALAITERTAKRGGKKL